MFLLEGCFICPAKGEGHQVSLGGHLMRIKALRNVSQSKDLIPSHKLSFLRDGKHSLINASLSLSQ